MVVELLGRPLDGLLHTATPESAAIAISSVADDNAVRHHVYYRHGGRYIFHASARDDLFGALREAAKLSDDPRAQK